jgi:RNA polymerase sigma-70 factor (ECF subfamily)
MKMGASRLTAENNDRERALLDLVVGQDREAFSELFELYHPRLFKFIYRLTHSHTISDELVNDIMLLVWRKAGTFRGSSKVSTWIFGIAYRQSMRRLSRDKSKLFQSIDSVELAAEEGTTPEIENWVRQGLGALPQAQRFTAMLVFYLGLSYEEISNVTDCPVSTVKTRMFHVRRKLKDILPAIALPESERAQQ